MKTIQNCVGDRVYIGGCSARAAAKKRCRSTEQDTYYWNGEKLEKHTRTSYTVGLPGEYGFCGSVVDKLKKYLKSS
jgi:hypothetical protein